MQSHTSTHTLWLGLQGDIGTCEHVFIHSALNIHGLVFIEIMKRKKKITHPAVTIAKVRVAS